jgi:SOS-response transcriptional repressor LexA
MRGRSQQQKLTVGQQKTLNFIRRYFEAKGFMPSLREIAIFNKRSIGSAQQFVAALEKRGYIERATDHIRAIKLLEK